MRSWHNYLGLGIPLLVIAGLIFLPTYIDSISKWESAFLILNAIALASSLNILMGYSGYLNFGHIFFFGFGGYIGFYFLNVYEWSLWASLLIAGLTSGLLAFFFGKAILRLRGAYFALATIGINELAKALINNLDFPGSEIGIPLKLDAYGGTIETLDITFYIMAGLACLAVVLSYFVRISKFGLGLLTIREDEDTAEAMGVDTLNTKKQAFVLSSIIPGMAGALFFYTEGIIDSQSAFSLHTSIELIIIIMVGGQGTVLGPVLGAIIYYNLMDAFFIMGNLPTGLQISFSGAILLIFVLFIPKGIVGWMRNHYTSLAKILR